MGDTWGVWLDMRVCGWTERFVSARGVWLDTCECVGGQKAVWPDRPICGGMDGQMSRRIMEWQVLKFLF